MPHDDQTLCKHCGHPMKRWRAPDIPFNDGLGFGASELLVCFNDACPLHVEGWNTLYESYGRIGSVRFWRNPADGDEGALPVAHKEAMRGDIIDD